MHKLASASEIRKEVPPDAQRLLEGDPENPMTPAIGERSPAKAKAAPGPSDPQSPADGSPIKESLKPRKLRNVVIDEQGHFTEKPKDTDIAWTGRREREQREQKLAELEAEAAKVDAPYSVRMKVEQARKVLCRVVLGCVAVGLCGG